jgi:hypothetical protein
MTLLIVSCAVVHAVSPSDPAAVRVAEGTKLCDQADKLLAAGDAAAALKLYQEVLTYLPTSPRAKAGVVKSTAALRVPLKVDGAAAAQTAPPAKPDGAAAAQAKALERARTVVLDQSHQSLFTNNGIADVLTRIGFNVLICDCTIDSSVKLSDCTVLCIQQIDTPIPFSTEEIADITRFVEEGGSLVLVGNPDLPIARVAEHFGVALKKAEEPNQLGALRATGSLQRLAGQSEILLSAPEGRCYLVGPQDAETLVESASGAPVAIGFPWGKGRVVCFADDASYWRFSGHKREGQADYPNAPLTAAIFRGLLPAEVQLGDKPGKRTNIWGENVRTFDWGRLLYPKTLEPYLQPIIDLLPRIDELVRRMEPASTSSTQFTVVAEASHSQSWAVSGILGLAVPPLNASRTSMANSIFQFGHEISHTHTDKLPDSFNEAWACYVGIRVAEELGYEDCTEAMMGGRGLSGFETADPTVRMRDIVDALEISDRFDEYRRKAYWMIEQLQAKYGPDFMPRFLTLFQATKWAKPATVRDVLDYFSKTAGEDLTPWYKSIGVTGGAPPAEGDKAK